MPCVAYAQYNPQEKGGDMSAFGVVSDIIGFVMDALQFFIGAWVIYLVLFVILASILYFTSGGDEDRMDTAMEWYKRSATGLIIAPILFGIIVFVSNTLNV